MNAKIRNKLAARKQRTAKRFFTLHSYRGRTAMKSTTIFSGARPIFAHAALRRSMVAATVFWHSWAVGPSPMTARTTRISVARTRTTARPSMAM